MQLTFAANDELAGSPVDVVDLHGDDFRRSQPKARMRSTMA